jgi:transposase-like protein
MAIMITPMAQRAKSEHKAWSFLNDLIEQISTAIVQQVKQHFEGALEEEIKDIVGRESYERRDGNDRTITAQAQCRKCQSRFRQHFQRDGHRVRELLTQLWGILSLWVPRLTCQCGGTVEIHFRVLPFRQRLGVDLTDEIKELGAEALSLRHIKARLDKRLLTSFGLRTINEQLHAIARALPQWREWPLLEVPPVVQFDALWIRVMKPTGKIRKDKQGRRRQVKGVHWLPVMVALGVWPDTGRKLILDWEIGTGPGENGEDWERLLTRLEARGRNPERGFILAVGDGGSGLLSALQTVYWDVAIQRCIFHILRNLLRAIRVPEQLSPKRAFRYRRKILRQAACIWQAAHKITAQERFVKFCTEWRNEQPEVVDTLERNFDATLTFYDVLAQVRASGQKWQASFMRSTSHVERLNRSYRHRLHRSIVYHSMTGLEAALCQMTYSINQRFAAAL